MATRLAGNVISPLTARKQFDQIIRRASREGERFVVGRGDARVVIIGLREYIRAIAPAPEWLGEIRAAAKQKGLNKLSMREINAEIAATRRKQQGNNKGTRKRSIK